MATPGSALIGKSLLGGFTALRENARSVAGVWALCCVLPHILIFTTCTAFGVSSDSLPSVLHEGDPRILQMLGLFGLIGFVWLIFQLFAATILINVAVQSTRRQPVPFGRAIAQAATRIVPLIGAMLLAFFGLTFGLLLLILPGLFLLVRFAFGVCFVCADGLPPIPAFRQSWKITSGYFWSTMGLIICVVLAMVWH